MQKFFYALWSLAVLAFSSSSSKDVDIQNASNDINVPAIVESEEPQPVEHYDETLSSRGNYAKHVYGINYVNVIGYVARDYIYEDDDMSDIKGFPDQSIKKFWSVPTYTRDKQFWKKSGTLPHKTEVVVREQIPGDMRVYGAFYGYLLVERTDDKSQHYIDVRNFVTKPYWTYPIDKGAAEGYLIARFNQVSDYYPLTYDRKKMQDKKFDIPDGTLVLVTGYIGGPYYKYDNDIHGMVFKKTKNSYRWESGDFNSRDLTVIY